MDSISEVAYQLAIKTKYLAGQAKALTCQGVAKKYLGMATEAMTHHVASLAIYKQLKDSVAIARCYSNLGIAEKELGNFAAASRYQLASIRLAEKIGDEDGVARAHQNLGLVYKLQDLKNDALKHYRITESIYRRLKDTAQLIKVIENKIPIFTTKGLLDSAIRQNEEVLTLSLAQTKGKKRSSNLLSPIAVHKQISYFAAQNGDTAKAAKHRKEALALSKEYVKNVVGKGDKLTEGRARNALAGSFQMIGLLDSAKTQLEMGVKLMEESRNGPYLNGAYYGLAKLDSLMASDPIRPTAERLSLAQQSLRNFMLAENVKYKVLNEENYKQLQNLKLEFETELKDKEIANQKWLLQHQKWEINKQTFDLKLKNKENVIVATQNELLKTQADFDQLAIQNQEKKLAQQKLEAKFVGSVLELERRKNELKNKDLQAKIDLRDGILAGGVALIIIAWLLFWSFRLHRKLELQQVVLNQRQRLSADLHDDVGATLSSISIYTEAIKNKLKHSETENVMELVNKIGENARETISTLGDIVWNLNPMNDSAEKLFGRIESTAFTLLSAQNAQLEFKVDSRLYDLNFSIESKQNIFLIFKESLNNCLKYSGAKTVKIDLRKDNAILEMTLADDGHGFDLQKESNGNGLRNMKRRTESMQGSFAIQSSDKGTTTSARIPFSALLKS